MITLRFSHTDIGLVEVAEETVGDGGKDMHMLAIGEVNHERRVVSGTCLIHVMTSMNNLLIWFTDRSYSVLLSH